MLQSRIKGSASVLGDGPGFDHIVFNETAPYIKGHSSCTFTDVKIDVYLNMTSGCPDDKAFPRGAWTCGTIFEGPQGAKEAFAACNLDPYCEAVTAGYPGEGISYHLTRGAEVYDPENRNPGDPSWDKWCPCPNWFTWVCQRPPGFTLPPTTTTTSGLAGTWELTGSGCTMDGDCISSRNYPRGYGNRDACNVQLHGNVPLKFDAFNTESRYDFLTVGGTKYSGPSNKGPADGSYSGSMSWASDGSVT